MSSSRTEISHGVTVLTVSRNLPLQEERRMFLEAAGYSVVAAHTNAEALDALHSWRSINIMLICHSIPEEDRVLLAAATRKARPALPILMLYNGYDPTRASVDGALHGVDDPETLVNMVGFLTAPHPHST